MESQFFCPACNSDHTDPAEARLGHRVVCLDCAIQIEIDVCDGYPAIHAEASGDRRPAMAA